MIANRGVCVGIVAPIRASAPTFLSRCHITCVTANAFGGRPMENPHDIALRAHIQDQLLDYVNEHININHIAYTEYVATKVCSPQTYLESLPCHHSPTFGSNATSSYLRISDRSHYLMPRISPYPKNPSRSCYVNMVYKTRPISYP